MGYTGMCRQEKMRVPSFSLGAAQQGMVFASLTLEQGIKIALSLWNRVYFVSGLTLE